MGVRAVVFDVGGVIEMTTPTGWQARWARRLGLDECDLTERLEKVFQAGEVGTVNLREVEREAAERLGLGSQQLPGFMADLWEEYLGTLNQELVDYFQGLRPHYRTGILSNSFVGARERERDAYNLEAMCDVVVYSHEEGMKKPDHRFFNVVCARLAVAPSDVVFVDDTPGWLDAARDLGMKAVHFCNNTQAVAEINFYLRDV